jgi:hypothetical protein
VTCRTRWSPPPWTRGPAAGGKIALSQERESNDEDIVGRLSGVFRCGLVPDIGRRELMPNSRASISMPPDTSGSWRSIIAVVRIRRSPGSRICPSSRHLLQRSSPHHDLIDPAMPEVS